MSIARLYRNSVFCRLLKAAPKPVMRAVRWMARRDALRAGAEADPLAANFSRAFPELDDESLRALCVRHRQSQYQCGVIQELLRRQDRSGLRRHAEKDVHYRSATMMERIAAHEGPVVLLTPHYGTYVSASLRLLLDIGPRKPFSIFFDDPARNASTGDFEGLYRRFDAGASVLHNNRRSIVMALKALQRGEVLTMMPDVYAMGGNHVMVPFFGGLTHAMTGTAFFALKADALLVPVFASPKQGLEVEVDILEPIALSHAEDFEQALHETTAAIFACMEARLREVPEHWIYWSELHRRFPCNTRVPEGSNDDWHACLERLLMELRGKVPALEPLLNEVGRRAKSMESRSERRLMA